MQSKDNAALTAALDGLTPESAIIASGTVVSAPAVKLGGPEIALDSVEICGVADAQLPISRNSGIDKWMDHRQVSLRYPEQQLVFTVQTTLEQAMRAAARVAIDTSTSPGARLNGNTWWMRGFWNAESWLRSWRAGM